MKIKRVSKMIMLFSILFILAACNTAQTTAPETAPDIHGPEEIVSDAQTALQFLKEGNQRFVNNQAMSRDSNTEDRGMLSDGQSPFAVVVTCSDSRVPPELYFDQKLGDIFVIRNAGNIADDTALGSIEYAVEHLHTPLVVVVGHSSCGAVTGAFEGGEFPENLQGIIDTIDTSIAGSSDLNDAILDNINGVAAQIKNDEIIHEMGAEVVEAHYNLESGEVEWLE
ncbi:MAG: carbonic anhydrase [Clostridiales bacterium]|jgi:carbonic anhydrase|nr:carbonic anhydrase [Clostridiales bacterium]